MTTLRPMSVFVAGLAVTLLLLGLPILHTGWRPVGVELAFLLMPSALLIAVTFRPALSWLTHLAFPVSHLPLLVLRPELTSPEIYAGPRGVLALLAIAAAFAVYLVAVTPRLLDRPAPRGADALTSPAPRALPPGAGLLALGLAFALGPAIAFALPALRAEVDPHPAALSILLGPLVALGAVGLGLARDLLLTPVPPAEGPPEPAPAGEPTARDRAFLSLAMGARPRGRAYLWASLFVMLMLGLTAFWYLWSPR